jgi:hypothetical protein
VKVPERLQLNEGTSINEFSVDGLLSGNSTFAVPTEQAVKTYVDKTVSDLAKSITAIQTGRKKITKGAKNCIISFDEELEDAEYTVSALLNCDKFYNWILKSVASNGFTISFSEKLQEDVILHWVVLH